MARVVHKRSAPPYLTFVFAFLFVIATALAFWSHLNTGKADKDLAELRRTTDRLANATERRQDTVKDLQADRKKGSVVAQLDGQVSGLARLITGAASSYKDAKLQAEAFGKDVDGTAVGLIHIARTALDAQKAADQAKEHMTGEVARLNAELAKLSQSKADMSAANDNALAELNEAAQAQRDQLQAESQAHQAAMEQIRTSYDKNTEELNRNIAEKTKEITRLKLQSQRQQAAFDKLQAQHNRLARPDVDETMLARQPDGKILRVVRQDNLCYISLGANDNITPGLTFTVYPVSGIPKDGEGKAVVVVTNIGADTSECQIVSQDRNDPIVAGNPIANLAFDPTRKYTFVVEGDFDLSGRGRPTSAGAKEVKAIIQQFGGVIADRLDIDTDFVVMGREPAMPPTPAESAPRAVWKLYQEQKQTYGRYQQVKLLAQSLRKQVLNTNSFMAFLGYMPQSQTR